LDQRKMARLRGFEPPTSGSGEQAIVLTRSENFGLYYIREGDTTILG
jgi:hypothetical protein